MFFLCYNRRGAPRFPRIDATDIIQKLTPDSKPNKGGAIDDAPIHLIQCINWNSATSLLE
jgi:hypothetical protein